MNDKPPRADPTDRVMKIPPVDSPRHEEALLDQAVAESFPASDPISPAVAARMEPADVSLDKNLANGAARTKDRIGRNMPLLVGIGTAALALLAMRALRGGRNRHSRD